MKDLMKLHDAAVAAALAVAAKNLGDRDIPSRSELEVAVTEQAEEIERLTLRLKMTSDTMNGYMLERNALQAKLDTATQSSAHWQHQYTELQAKLSAMEKQEPVAYSVGNTLKWHEGNGMTDAQLYAAPKVAQPLSDEQIANLHRDAYTTGKAFTTIEVYHYFARAIEAAHNIGGQQP